MKNGNAIEVADVYKKYKKYFDKSRSLKERILDRKRNEYQEHWVLKGLHFEVKKGEAVGLIGRNGCGKSTCLKLLTKIIYPDKGRIEVSGRISSLLELGAGFHPDLSGFENIYLNAAVFGLSRKEIDARVDEIIRFSELEEYIYNPIRTYSSGMYMKLAFSVAINVDADILLIDEILGVGDVSYQKKCFEKLMEIKNCGTTIIIVSHSTDQIEKICDRSIWIEDGIEKLSGDPKKVHAYYLETMEEGRLFQKKKEAEERRRKEFEKRKKEIENRKKQRQNLSEQDVHNGSLDMEQLFIEEQKEIEFQKKMQKIAEEKRECQKKVHEAYKYEEIPENKRKIEYYKKEAARLQFVADEKNAEIDRLNSAVRQKDIETSRLKQVIFNKEEENDRLEAVILEKESNIEHLNMIILEKDDEISRMNNC